MPSPDFVAATNDELSLFCVALLSCLFIVRRAIAKDPKAGFVIKVGLAVDPFDALLRFVWQTEAVLVEESNESPFGRRIGVEVPQHRLILLLIVTVGGVGLDFDSAEGQFIQGVFDQVAVDDFVVALVVIAEQVVIGRGGVVIGIVETADLFGGFDYLEEYLRVFNELREDAETPLSGLVDEDIRSFRVAERDDTNLVGLHLKTVSMARLRACSSVTTPSGLRPSAATGSM